MNKYLFYLLLPIICLSCTEDIDLLAPYKECAIIYGFLDKSDTAHYVVIQKGFTNPNESAVNIAQNPDSLYFNNISVTVDEINKQGVVTNTFPLDKVDLTNEGYRKDTGIFASSPNYAYKFKAALSTDKTYRLKVQNGGIQYMAETPIIPVDSNTMQVSPSNWRESRNPLLFTEDRTTKLFWIANNAYSFYGYLTIPYFEINNQNPQDTTEGEIKWVIVNNIETNGQGSYAADKDLYSLKDAIKGQLAAPSSSSIIRYYGYLSFHLFGGSTRLTHFQELVRAKQGLAAGQVSPEFKEGILTENTYGLFDTRGSAQYYKLEFDPRTENLLIGTSDMLYLNVKGFIPK